MNSRSKGARGELEAAEYLTGLFKLPVHRGRQYRGGPDSPDVAGLEGMHFEVKRCQRFNVERALCQAERDASVNAVPVVMHRANREPWKITLRADDLLRFLDAANRLIEEGHQQALAANQETNRGETPTAHSPQPKDER